MPCEGLFRSRHLRPVTGSPGGVVCHAEPAACFGACLSDLIRWVKDRAETPDGGSPPSLSYTARKENCWPGRAAGSVAGNDDVEAARPLRTENPKAETHIIATAASCCLDGSHVMSWTPGLPSRWSIIPTAHLFETAWGQAFTLSPAIASNWFMRGPGHGSCLDQILGTCCIIKRASEDTGSQTSLLTTLGPGNNTHYRRVPGRC